jgi:hypothetical protein
LEVKDAPAVFGAKAKTFFLRFDDVLGFTVVFCIELYVFVGSAFVLKALTRKRSVCKNSFAKPRAASNGVFFGRALVVTGG